MNNVTCDHCDKWWSRNPDNVQHIAENEDGTSTSRNYCDEECAAEAMEGDDGD